GFSGVRCCWSRHPPPSILTFAPGRVRKAAEESASCLVRLRVGFYGPGHRPAWWPGSADDNSTARTHGVPRFPLLVGDVFVLATVLGFDPPALPALLSGADLRRPLQDERPLPGLWSDLPAGGGLLPGGHVRQLPAGVCGPGWRLFPGDLAPAGLEFLPGPR